MKYIKTKFAIAVIASLAIGLACGYCICFFPMQKEIKNYENNFEYYRDKYLNECEIYDKIIEVASNQQFDDYSKLYYIRSTYTQPGRWHEIDKALKLKKSLERNKELKINE